MTEALRDDEAEICDCCVYYSRPLMKKELGQCRRYAPRPTKELKRGNWPEVYEDDWCGEFKVFRLSLPEVQPNGR